MRLQSPQLLFLPTTTRSQRPEELLPFGNGMRRLEKSFLVLNNLRGGTRPFAFLQTGDSGHLSERVAQVKHGTLQQAKCSFQLVSQANPFMGFPSFQTVR